VALAACQAEPGDSPAASVEEGNRAALPVPTAGGTAPEDSATADESDGCGADRLGRYLNVLPTATIMADIATAVEHDRIRYIAPGDAVTEDFRPDRLNVETGVDGRIKLFRCG